MAVTRRGFIFGAFVSSLLSVLLIIVVFATDSWIVATPFLPGSQQSDGNFRYGLFRGEMTLVVLASPTVNELFMTCVLEVNACAVSCKLIREHREAEVRALSQGHMMDPSCLTEGEYYPEMPLAWSSPVIPASFYIILVLILALQFLFALISCILALVNATRNPTEPVFGLPGCLWSNVTAAILGTVALLMWGVYWAASYLQEHLAFSYTAVGALTAVPSLGYSYWVLIIAIVCSLTNVGLLQLRKFLLEKEPPPPTITIENHSDGTLILY